MTAIHTIKFTRSSIEHQWPFSHFFKQWWEHNIFKYLLEEQPSDWKDNTLNPLTIQNSQHRWHFETGFVDYNYSEYDPMTDIKAAKLIEEKNDTFDMVTIDQKLTYNPSTLTLTQNITFDNFDNLKSFLMKSKEQFVSPTREEVFNYLAEKGIMVVEETQVDGNSVDTIKLFS